MSSVAFRFWQHLRGWRTVLWSSYLARTFSSSLLNYYNKRDLPFINFVILIFRRIGGIKCQNKPCRFRHSIRSPQRVASFRIKQIYLRRKCVTAGKYVFIPNDGNQRRNWRCKNIIRSRNYKTRKYHWSRKIKFANFTSFRDGKFFGGSWFFEWNEISRTRQYSLRRKNWIAWKALILSLCAHKPWIINFAPTLIYLKLIFISEPRIAGPIKIFFQNERSPGLPGDTYLCLSKSTVLRWLRWICQFTKKRTCLVKRRESSAFSPRFKQSSRRNRSCPEIWIFPCFLWKTWSRYSIAKLSFWLYFSIWIIFGQF